MVKIMAAQYPNLTLLLLHNERAKHFYDSLDVPIQVAVTTKGETICSMQQLRDAAVNAMGIAKN